MTRTLRASTSFLKDQGQYSGSENRLATMPRMYPELAPNQSLPVGVQRKPTPKLKASPPKSVYKAALLAQDKNPTHGNRSLYSMQIKVASFYTALENSTDHIQKTQGSSCV